MRRIPSSEFAVGMKEPSATWPEPFPAWKRNWVPRPMGEVTSSTIEPSLAFP